jgi:SAM-dependent methyltransferase
LSEGMKDRLRSRLRVNPSRVRLEAFVARAAASVPPGGDVLDAGSGEGMYRHHFTHTSYESADFLQVDKQYAQVDYVCDLRSIPVPDERYDLVLLTQVLEHLPEPRDVLLELRRVLKPAGRLWLSTPLYFEEHEQPYDFYRYTQFGLRHLLTEAGLAVEELDWLEGYYGTLHQQCLVAWRSLPVTATEYGGGLVGRSAAFAARAARPAFLAGALALAQLELRHQYTRGGHCKNYRVIAARA